MTVSRIARVVLSGLALGIAARSLAAQAPQSIARPVGVRSATVPPPVMRGVAVPPLVAAASQRHHEGLGALVGALAGGTVLVLAVNNCEHHSTSTDGPPCGIGYTFLPAFIAAGALLGAAVGHFIPARSTLPPAA